MYIDVNWIDGVSQPRQPNELSNSGIRAMERPVLQETNLLNNFDTSSGSNWFISQSNLGGRGLFASKAIKQGSLIYKNKPLAVGPRPDSAGHRFCAVCYKVSDTCISCDTCSLFLCNDKCKQTQQHNTICEFISKNWAQRPDSENNSRALSKILIYLKLILLKTEVNSFLHVFQTSPIEKHSEFEEISSRFIISQEHLKFMDQVRYILKLNSFRISHMFEGNKIPLRGFYPISAFLNHSCVPNTRSIFKSDHTMEVYASKDIDIGEEILTCYTGLLWSTPARRCHLYKTKKFWCKCKRCQDKTEMGTNLSALKCLNKDCLGVLQPATATNPRTCWYCDNCGLKVPAQQISTIHSVLGSLVGTLNLDNELRLETKILERLANFVPFSNHIFVDLRLRLVLKLGFSDGLKFNELTESRLSLKLVLCRDILATLAALGLEDSHLCGLLFYHLHATLAERARRHPDLYDGLKSEIESTIERAYRILRGDISAPVDLELRYRYLGPDCEKPQQERFSILSI